MNTMNFETLSDVELDLAAGSGLIGKIVGHVEDKAVGIVTTGVKKVAGVGAGVLGAGSELLGAGASILGGIAGQ